MEICWRRRDSKHDSNTEFEDPDDIVIGIERRIEDHLKAGRKLDFRRELMPVVQFHYILITRHRVAGFSPRKSDSEDVIFPSERVQDPQAGSNDLLRRTEPVFLVAVAVIVVYFYFSNMVLNILSTK